MSLRSTPTIAVLAPLLAFAIATIAPYRANAQTGGAAAAVESLTRALPPRVATARTAMDSSADSVASAAAATADEDPLAVIRANFTPENRNYSDIKTALRFISPFYAVIVMLLVLFTGLSARMRDIAHAFGHRRYVRVLVYLVLLTLVAFVLMFPFAWYDTFAVEHQFGLSNQTLGAWFGDQVKQMLVSTVFLGLVPLLWLMYRLIAKSPRRWWLWLGLATLPLIIMAALITPLVIDPLFNKFTPLRDQQLKQRILDLGSRAGIPGRNVYEVDKSEDTKKFNAYVNGFGASQRIVLWDTTLKGMREDEILFVMGHEMGHYVLGHIWRGIAITSGICLLMFFLAGRISQWAMARFGGSWGFQTLDDVASMPLLYSAATLVLFLANPLTNAYTRNVETEADVYGLELTHDNAAAARAFVKLGSQNKSNPEPSGFVEMFLYSHPPDGKRVRLAQTYRPWEQGRPNRYFKEGSAR